MAGWSYHYWNGACFGVVFAVALGRKPLWVALVYGVFRAVGFLVSPAVSALGIGFMGTHMPGMPVTVLLAHLAYAALLGLLTRRWVRDAEWIFGRRPSLRTDLP